MASESKSSAEGMEVVDESVEILDEYEMAFNDLEEAVSPSIGDIQTFLQNPRTDEVAIKIKEKCIYK